MLRSLPHLLGVLCAPVFAMAQAPAQAPAQATAPAPAQTTAQTTALVPAGSINAAVASKPHLLLAPDDAAVMKFVAAIRDRLFAGSTILSAPKDAAELAGNTLVVYATPDHWLLRKHRDALPFTWGEGSVTVDGRTFRGEHLRLIAAVRNPANPTRRAVLYLAARAADLIEINSVFHGPTEWVVADGKQQLASGSFLRGVALSRAQMAADLEEIAATLRDVHPATVDELPPPLAAAIAAAKERIGQPLERLDFAKLLAGVVLSLHDAHTAVALPLSGEALDVPFVWIGDGPIVMADAGPLLRGDRIVAIAGVATDELERRLAAVVPSENEHWLRHQAANLLPDLGFLAAIGVATAAPLQIRIERGGDECDVEVGLRAAARRTNAPPWVRYEIDAERSLGVFTFDRCVVDKQFLDTLAKFFAAVHEQGIRKVAVDLRANAGGNSRVTNEFLRYVAVDEYADFSGDVRWSARVYAQRGGSGKPRFTRATPQRRSNEKVSEPDPFRGELFVLVGPATFSSGNWFATVMQDNELARIVGEPTGNAPSSYGDILSLVLPESGTSYTVSHKRWVRPDPSRDPAPALVPDVAVPRTRESVRKGHDPVLEWLRAQK
ncbi:MAG TPA: S41 family peptidase [Planctomycetota bacterium]